MIDKKLLLDKKESIIRQRDNAFAVHQQAIGALTLIEHLLENLEQDDKGMPLEKFVESIGADSAEIVDIKQAS